MNIVVATNKENAPQTVPERGPRGLPNREKPKFESLL